MSANLTSIQDVAHLEELLSDPTEGVVRILGGLDGDMDLLTEPRGVTAAQRTEGPWRRSPL